MLRANGLRPYILARFERCGLSEIHSDAGGQVLRFWEHQIKPTLGDVVEAIAAALRAWYLDGADC